MSRSFYVLILLGCCCLLPTPAQALEEGEDALNGRNLNTLLGADTFYNAGYDGTGVAVANVEAGHVWNGHLSLQHVATYYQGSDAVAPFVPGEFDLHATAVGMVIGGRPNASRPDRTEEWRGIAYGADLRSGAIAKEWTGATLPRLAFQATLDNMEAAYGGALNGGVDVINSSWGGPIQGNEEVTALVAALARTYGKTVVFSAGNSGDAPNTVQAPAWSNNVIAVAALTTDSNGDYNAVAGYSSRGPQDFYNPGTSTFIPGVRADVDIAAPGSVATASYRGATGGNNGGTDDLSNGRTFVNLEGTSFAAPIVAGGATLLADVAHDRAAAMGGVTEATDGRVIRSVLLNSADKITGWDNGQHNVAGVITTTQSLDWASGAGRLNLDKAFHQFTDGTTNLLGIAGGSVDSTGWDYGSVGAANRFADYFITQRLTQGSMLDATLSWFSGEIYLPETNEFFYGHFSNLDLEIWAASETGDALFPLAISSSLYNPVEHLHFSLPQDGYYLIRAEWLGDIYDFVNFPDEEPFGIAWAVAASAAAPVPEPSTLGLAALGVLGLAIKARRKRYPPGVKLSGRVEATY